MLHSALSEPINPLHAALMYHNNTPQILELVDRGADLTFTYNGMNALHHAIKLKRQEDGDIAEALITPVTIESPYNGMTPLHHALITGALGFVGELIRQHANLYATYEGMTCLERAQRIPELKLFLEEWQKENSPKPLIFQGPDNALSVNTSHQPAANVLEDANLRRLSQ